MSKQRSVLWIPLLYVGIILFTNIIGVAIYESIDIQDEDLKFIRYGSISNLIFYGSLFICYILLFLPAWKKTMSRYRQNTQDMLMYTVIGSIAMFGMMFLMGYVYYFVGIEEQAENQALLEMQLTGAMFDRLSLIAFAVLLAPFVEEMMFRLAGFRLLKRFPQIPKWAVIAITSILFGLIHVLGDDLIQIIYYAGLGVILGVIYDKSKNILVPIVVHMIFNGVIMVLMFTGI